MAEIGLIASVVGVTGAALAASKALSDMIDQVRNAPEEIIAISNDTHSFHGIITNVQVAITDQFIVSKLETEQHILRAVKQLEEPLKNCATILTQMRSRIKSHLKQNDDGGFRVSNFDMRWMFQRKDVMDCRNRLETTKSTLNAALSSVVFLCHMKMMGSLGQNLDVLPISGLDVDAGSALREYAESTASRSPPNELDVDAGSALREYAELRGSQSSPLDSAFEPAGRYTELPAQGFSIVNQPSLEKLRGLRTHISKTADRSLILPGAPNSDPKAIASSKSEVPALSEANATSFRSAIDARDIGKIELMLAENYDANISAAKGWTALHVAVDYGRVDIVQILIERNADINGKASLGLTPIVQAAKKGHDDLVRTLLNAKDIDVNTTGQNGTTPLHHATFNGHDDVVRTLLNAKNIDVNATRHDGSTALHLAANRGHKGIVEMILDNNADISAENEQHCTALMIAIDSRQEDVAILLIQRGSPLINTWVSKASPLYGACDETCSRMVKGLIEKGKSSGQLQAMLEVSYKGFRPLHVAASRGSLEITSQLVEAGADLNVRNDFQQTPLIRAARAGQLQMMEYFIKQGADRTAKDEDERDYLQVLKEEQPDKYEEYFQGLESEPHAL